jgi:hypothetical protein
MTRLATAALLGLAFAPAGTAQTGAQLGKSV